MIISSSLIKYDIHDIKKTLDTEIIELSNDGTYNYIDYPIYNIIYPSSSVELYMGDSVPIRWDYIEQRDGILNNAGINLIDIDDIEIELFKNLNPSDREVLWNIPQSLDKNMEYKLKIYSDVYGEEIFDYSDIIEFKKRATQLPPGSVLIGTGDGDAPLSIYGFIPSTVTSSFNFVVSESTDFRFNYNTSNAKAVYMERQSEYPDFEDMPLSGMYVIRDVSIDDKYTITTVDVNDKTRKASFDITVYKTRATQSVSILDDEEEINVLIEPENTPVLTNYRFLLYCAALADESLTSGDTIISSESDLQSLIPLYKTEAIQMTEKTPKKTIFYLNRLIVNNVLEPLRDEVPGIYLGPTWPPSIGYKGGLRGRIENAIVEYYRRYPIPMITLVSPSNNATDVSLLTTFEWRVSQSSELYGNITYELFVEETAGGGGTNIGMVTSHSVLYTGLTNTSKTVEISDKLNVNSNYKWWVAALSSDSSIIRKYVYSTEQSAFKFRTAVNAPNITSSEASIDFGPVLLNTTSSAKQYVLSANNLHIEGTDYLTATPTDNQFKLSLTGEPNTFDNYIRIPYSGNSVTKNIHVIFKPNVNDISTAYIQHYRGPSGQYRDNLLNVSVTGTGIQPYGSPTASGMINIEGVANSELIFNTPLNNPSAIIERLYYVSTSPISDNLYLKCESPFELCISGQSSWSTLLVLNRDSNGKIQRTGIKVRMNPSMIFALYPMGNSFNFDLIHKIGNNGNTIEKIQLIGYTPGFGGIETSPANTLNVNFRALTSATQELKKYIAYYCNAVLVNDVEVKSTHPAFTLSTQENGQYSDSVILKRGVDGKILNNPKIYIKFKPTNGVQTYYGALTHKVLGSNGSVLNIKLYGSVVGAPNIISNTK